MERNNQTGEIKYYLGIPIPTDEELQRMSFTDMLEAENGGFTVENLGGFISSSSVIDDYIRFDQDFWAKNEMPEDVSQEGAMCYTGSIEKGYSCVFGSLALIGFFRSEKGNLLEYLAEPEKLFESTRFLPHRQFTFDLAKEIRRGSGVIDRFVHGDIDDSSLVAWMNSGDVLFESVRLDGFIEDIYIATADKTSHRYKDDIYMDLKEGFYHGVKQAMQLCILSAESEVIGDFFKS